MKKQDFWEVFKDTGDPAGYLLYRGAQSMAQAQTSTEQPAQSQSDDCPPAD